MKTFPFLRNAILTLALLSGGYSWGRSQSTQQPTPSSSRIQKVIGQVQKIGKDQDVTITLTSDLEYYGMITQIGTDRFEIDEVDLRQVVTVPFKDVRNVRKGYGKADRRTGRRDSNRTRLKRAALFAVFGRDSVRRW